MADTRINPPDLSAKQIQRFWSRVDKAPGHGPKGECWLWNGWQDDDGYGRICLTVGGEERKITAHRLAHFLLTGEWPENNVLHSCDNAPCCNPAHLSGGTQKQNIQEALLRGRMNRGTGNPAAKLTAEQVLQIRQLQGVLSIRVTAQQFGIGRTTVKRVWNRTSWKHI